MHLVEMKVFSFLFVQAVYTFTLYNDLLPLYEISQETTDSSERAWLLLEEIQGLTSFLLKNVSQICPLNQPKFLQRVEKITLNTLAEIYENEETLLKILFYENIIPPVRATLEKCARSPNSRISLDEYYKQQEYYANTILHVDLKHRSDVNKWLNVRPCIRTQIKSNIYLEEIPSSIDTLWQTFLLGYLGCSDFWGPIKEWSFLDLIQQVIIRPLFQRWSSKFLIKIEDARSNNNNATSVSEKPFSPEIKGVHTQTNADETKFSLKKISSWLENCNVILLLRHSVDPIPCFNDVI